MNVIEKINLILKKANISKVNLAKYLGVSRQMVYNYLDAKDLSKFPNEKCQMLFELLDVNSADAILSLDLNEEYLQKVGSKIFISGKENKKDNVPTITLEGVEREYANLISDIVLMLKNIVIDDRSREGEDSFNTITYLHHFVQNLVTNKDLKYMLGFISKNFGYTDPNKYVFDENNQFVFESIMFSAFTLYTNGGASRTRLTESHRKWENALSARKEEKLSRTQELNTARIEALRELGYNEITNENASEVFDKIAEIMSQKF